jgi:DNA-binding response OmpR family regulator
MTQQTPGQDSVKRGTILVIDDHPDIRRLLRLTLEKNYVVLEAADGRSALQMLARHRPPLVLLDIMMPGELDGLQVLDAIKNDPQLQCTLVAMVTARAQTMDSIDARMRGADAYFIKPFTPRDIRAWVDARMPTTQPSQVKG